MIASIVLFILKFIFSTAFLTIIYLLLFKNKASYRQQRVILLLTPFLGIIAATVSFEYIPLNGNGAEAIRSLNESIVSIVEPVSEQSKTADITDYESFSKSSSMPVKSSSINTSNSDILIGIYILIVVVLSTFFTISVLKIYNIKRLATKININSNLALYKSGLIESPFSFLKSIYVDRKTSGERLFMILEHERFHIENKHYIDKIVMTFLQVFLWFNPIIWYIRNEIEKIHEFESDQNVLKKGTNKVKYQQYIVEELTPAVPIVANGFNNSLIKKRFVMMRTNYKASHELARKLLTAPLVLVLFTLTVFTYAKEEAILSNTNEITKDLSQTTDSKLAPVTEPAKVEETVTPADAPPQDTVIIIGKNSSTDSSKNGTAENTSSSVMVKGEDIVIKNSVGTITISENSPMSEANKDAALLIATFNKIKKEIPSKYDVDHSRISKIDNKILETVPISYNGDKNYLWEVDTKLAYYKIPKESINPYTGTKKNNGIEVLGVIANKDNTLVDVVATPPYNAYWISFNSNCSLVDNKSGDKYIIHSIKNGLPITHPLLIYDMKDIPMVFTLIFPPLKDNVQKVDFIEFHDSEIKSPPNGSGLFKWNNLEVLRGRKATNYYGTKGEVIRMK